MGAFMSSFRTFQCAQPLNVLVLGLALASSVGYAGGAPPQAQVSTGECEPTPPDSHSALISEMKAPKSPVDAVSPPRLLYAVDPEFPAGISDPNFSGSTTVAMLVDANGRPQQVHVARSLGAAFDENAVKALNQYRFEPARSKGKPAPAKICIEILFRR